MRYEITFEENAAEGDLQVVYEGLEDTVRQLFKDKSRTQVAFFVRDEIGRIVGGVTGNHGFFGWLHINTLWVHDEARGLGLGRRLMEAIEAEAVKQGCKYAFLNTMSFQVPEFYKKLGYTVFAELEDYPGEHSRIFFRKKLV